MSSRPRQTDGPTPRSRPLTTPAAWFTPRALVAGLAAMALALSSCSPGDDGEVVPPDTGSEPIDSSSPVSPSEVSAAPVDGPVRFGDGRAFAARASTVADETIVMTSVGIAVHDPAGSRLAIERNLDGGEWIAVSPNSDLVAIVDPATASLEVRSVSEGSVRMYADLPPDVVHSVWFDDDATGVVVSSNQTVTQWSLDGSSDDLVAAAPDQIWLGPAATTAIADPVVAMRARPSGHVLVVSSRASGVRELALDVGDEKSVGRVVLSPDGRLAAVEVLDVLDPADGSIILVELSEPSDDGASATAAQRQLPVGSRDGQLAIDAAGLIVAADTTAIRWVDGDGNVVAERALDPNDSVTGISVAADGDTVTAHDDGSLTVWESPGVPRGELPSVGGTLLEFDRIDGSTLLTVARSGRIDRWDVAELQPIETIDRFARGAVNDVVVSPNGQRIALARGGGATSVVDLETGSIAVDIDSGGRNVDSVAFSPDGGRIVTGIGERLAVDAFDDTVTIHDASSEALLAQMGGEGESVIGCSGFRNLVRYSPDGEVMAANSHDFTVSLYDAGDLGLITTLPAHGGRVLDFAFSADGTRLATSSEDWTVRIWDVASGELVAEHETPLGGYWSVAFSPDGSTLAVIGVTGDVSLVGVDDGEIQTTFAESASWTSNIEFSPDGSLLAAGGTADDILVWSVDSGAVTNRLVGHSGPVNAIAFSPGGGLLVSGSSDGTARRWAITA